MSIVLPERNFCDFVVQIGDRFTPNVRTFSPSELLKPIVLVNPRGTLGLNVEGANQAQSLD